MRNQVNTYYEGELGCDDMTCGLVTKQISVCGQTCLSTGCRGKMSPVFSEKVSSLVTESFVTGEPRNYIAKKHF